MGTIIKFDGGNVKQLKTKIVTLMFVYLYRFLNVHKRIRAKRGNIGKVFFYK